MNIVVDSEYSRKMESAQYFSQCSINGFNYIFDTNKKQTPLSHRVGWTLAVIISCGICIWFAILIHQTVLNTHTITTVASSTYQVGRVPFPCISICNVNKVSRRDFQVIKNILLKNNVSEEEIELFGKSLASLITFSSFDYYPKKRKDHSEIFDILENNNYTVDVIMRTVQQDCTKFLKFCMLQSVPVNCSEFFTMIRTSEGYCCGFNYRGPEKFGDKSDVDFHEPEEQIYLSGYQSFGGMMVVLNFETYDYMSPVRPYYGGNVLINDATDYPESSAKSTVLQPWEPMEIRMKPWLIESTKNVAYLAEEVRNCLYNEGAGTTQAFYSYNSCLSKCRSLLMFKHCGCIPFFYLPIGKDNRRKCTLADNKCLHRKKKIFFSLMTNFSEGLNCNCKPECTDRFYDIDRRAGKVNRTMLYKYFQNLNSKDYTTLSVFYRRMTTSQFNLDVFMQWNDAFGFYGGLMSLGVGASLLSFMEIFAFYLFKFINRKFNKVIKVPKSDINNIKHTVFEYVD